MSTLHDGSIEGRGIMAAGITAIAVSVSERQNSASNTKRSAGSQTSPLAAGTGGGDAFGVAVSVDDGTQTAAASQREQDGLKALATLKQAAQQARDFNKKSASEKLALITRELALLKLLGTGIAAARQAVDLAKQVAAAVSLYAGSGGDAGAAGVTAPSAGAPSDSAPADGAADTGLIASASPDLAGASDPEATADAAGSGSPTAPSGATPPAAGSATAATATQQDPFYALANAVIAELKKYLAQILPSLQNSADPKVRAEAGRLSTRFDKLVATIQGTEPGSSSDVVSAAAPPPAINLVT
jgi:hypothetical protein